MENDYIKLSVINGKVLTFSHSDYIKLRSNHRIVGKFVGIPVCFQRNMMYFSMPVCFSEYETTLMIEQNFVKVEDKKGLKESPCESITKHFAEHQDKVISELQKPYVESRLEGIRNNMEHIIRGKRKKLIKMGANEEEITLTPDDILNEEATRIRQTIGNKPVYTHISTQHLFPVTCEIIREFLLADGKKYKVFRDLWLKGFFISGGDSFGCDFLAYPGDPMFYHASQIVHVIDSNQQFDAKYLISCVRLSVTVNKKCVFAYVDDDDTVTYQTLHWDNPKLRQVYANCKTETSQNVEKNE